MSISDPTFFKAVKTMDISVKENLTENWKADLEHVIEALELNHVNRALKLSNKKPTPYERKKAAKKGSSSTLNNINEFSKMIIGNFPVPANFETPWIFAQAIDQMLVKNKRIGLSMENKHLIIKEIDTIRSDFVKMFDIFMKKFGYCCGSVWGSKYIDRWCICTTQSPIIFVEKKTNDLFPKIFCEKCVDIENRENCRETHRHDYVEMERFQCQKCQKELHRQCSESFVANCCKSCDSTPFRYNSTSTKEAIASSPSSTSTSKSDISNLIQKENCFVKLLSEKKCPFSKPDLLENAIDYINVMKNEQQTAKDDPINQYLKPSIYLLQVYGLFYSTDEGDTLLAMAFCESHFDRCLIEILALPTTTTPTLKNEPKKELITKFFIQLITLYRNLVKAVHLRVPPDLKGLSAEIFADLIVELPRQNIAVKTLKETLSKKMSFFQIPCFSNDPRFIEIIHVIHELGFKINGKPPKLRSYLSVKDAAQNYINQLTNELVINGCTSSQPSETCNEKITEDKVPLILTPNDLLQAMTELHLKFSDIQSCYYSTFKIVSFFYDPRLQPLLPKSLSVDSGYSSLNSPTSSTNSMNYGHLINEEKEAAHVEKKPGPFPIELKGVRKRKIEHESPHSNVITVTSTTSESDEYDENTITMDSSTFTPNSNIITASSPSSDWKKFKYSIPYSTVSFCLSKEEENENCNICIPFTSLDSTSSSFDDLSTLRCDEKCVSFQVDPYPTASPLDETCNSDSENELQDVTRCPSVGSWMDFPSPLSDIEEDNDDTRSFSFCESPTCEEEEDDDFRSPDVFDSTSSTSSTEQDQPRCSTPCSAILKLLPPLYPSIPLSPPKVEVEEETEESVSTENPLLAFNKAIKFLITVMVNKKLQELSDNCEPSTSDCKDS